MIEVEEVEGRERKIALANAALHTLDVAQECLRKAREMVARMQVATGLRHKVLCARKDYYMKMADRMIQEAKEIRGWL